MPKKQRIYNYFYEFASEALHIVIFENFVKSMTSCLSKLKVTPKFFFPFKIPDDPTSSKLYTYIFFSFQRGVAPLHLASRHGHAHLIRLLLDHGADVNLPSRGGVCGLHLSSRCGHANAVELLLDKGTIHIRDHPYITSAKRWVDGVLACVAFCHNFEGFWFPSFEVVAC